MSKRPSKENFDFLRIVLVLIQMSRSQMPRQNSKSLNVKKIVAEVSQHKEQAFKHIETITSVSMPSPKVVSPKAVSPKVVSPKGVCILSPPLSFTNSFAKEMLQINALGDMTLKMVVANAKRVTVYTTRTEIVEGLRGLSEIYVNKQFNKMYKGGWVSLATINLNGFDYADVFPEKITDVEMNPEKSAIRATYGHKGYVAQIRYYGEYVPYSGPYTVFCFTHTATRGLGDINSKRRYNILRTPERTKSAGVVAYVNLAANPEMELWSRVGDRWQNEVCCLDTKISNFITKIVYDTNYMDNMDSNHNSDIVYLQEKWGLDRELASARVKALMFSYIESGDASVEVSDDDDLALEMESLAL